MLAAQSASAAGGRGVLRAEHTVVLHVVDAPGGPLRSVLNFVVARRGEARARIRALGRVKTAFQTQRVDGVGDGLETVRELDRIRNLLTLRPARRQPVGCWCKGWLLESLVKGAPRAVAVFYVFNAHPAVVRVNVEVARRLQAAVVHRVRRRVEHGLGYAAVVQLRDTRAGGRGAQASRRARHARTRYAASVD